MTETNPPTRRGLSSRITLLLVVSAFVVPILVAWWMARVQPPVSGGHLVNHGTFIRPPLDIHADDALAPLGAVPLAPSEWALVYYAPGACEDACVAAIEDLQTIRSLLGQATTRVRVAALIDRAGVNLAATHVVIDAAARERLARGVAAASGAGASREEGIVFLDWRGQIMMYFPDVSAPADIKKDLKRLLRASQIK
ncbi:MAG: hypothetical protein RLW42_18465 [Gammaproteobacteria bacterium]